MNCNLFVRKIDDKALVWFANKNKYAVFNSKTADILIDIDNKVPLPKIAKELANNVQIPEKEAIQFISDIAEKIYNPNVEQLQETVKTNIPILTKENYEVTNFYKINNKVFRVDFETETEAFWIHPKFAHLQIEATQNFDFHYQVYTKNNTTFLFVDKQFIGSWKREDIHYFQGKFSMELVQNIHQKKEDEWMGVFHASAVSNGTNSILFLGDSGDGKSTSLALLQANGFTCIVDDFVPICAEKQEVYSFPSAISIKKNSVPVLTDLYPELETTAEYRLKLLNKTVRYLPPNNSDYTKHLPCKALIFIKYQPEVDLQINTISSIKAFEKLVPDSWLSPKKENAEVFLNWFLQLPCYEIIYSDNEKMISTVKKIFTDEL